MLRRLLFLVLAVVLGVSAGLLARRIVPPEVVREDTGRTDQGVRERPGPNGPAKDPAEQLHSPAVVPAPPERDTTPIAELPHPVGYVVRGLRVNVVMSDGTVRTEKDSELQRVERNSVTIDGNKLFIRAASAVRVPAVQSAPVQRVD